MTGGQVVAVIVALAALVGAFVLLATRGRTVDVGPAIHGTVQPAPAPTVTSMAGVFHGEGNVSATTGPGSRTCRCGTPVTHACTDAYGARRVVVDATPHRSGTFEFIEPSVAGARVMSVDPTVKIRPTYRTHQCASPHQT